jgi:1-acyl-sn-glycerol-3-phosphate acyltransferase
MPMTVPMNIIRVLVAVGITTVAGAPMLCVIYSTYVVGLVCSWFGRKDLFDRVLAWNAWVAGVVAQNLWAKPLLKLVSVRVKTRGAEAVDWTSSHVICANHASIFDILALVSTVPPPFRFVAKRELLKWPIIGWTLRPAGQIVVDRADHTSSVGKIHEEATREIDGQVIFFVEGTRTRTGELLPFKKGAFHFALERRTKILPTAIAGSFGVLAKLPWWRIHPGRDIELIFAKPIEVSPVEGDAARYAEVQRLLETTRERIAASLGSTPKA